MKYINGKDIFPPGLLKQIQSYVSGMLVYIPSEEKRGWGETSGYRRCLAERNQAIRREFTHGHPSMNWRLCSACLWSPSAGSFTQRRRKLSWITPVP